MDTSRRSVDDHASAAAAAWPAFFIEHTQVARSGRDPKQFAFQLDLNDDSGLRDALLCTGRGDDGDGMPGQHAICEYLSKATGNRVTKLYFDRDEYLPAGQLAPTDAQLRLATAQVTDRMDRILDSLRGMDPRIQPYYRLAVRHGWVGCASQQQQRYKLSFRTFVSGVRIKYTDIPLFLNHKAVDQLADGFWDASVYKDAEQLMATIYGRKSLADGRVLLPVGTQDTRDDSDSNVRVTDYIIQYAPPDWLLLGAYGLQANQAPARAHAPGASAAAATPAAAQQRHPKTMAGVAATNADADADAAAFKKVEISEVAHLVQPLTQDAGLCRLFDNTQFNGLRFQYAHTSPDGRVVSLYIKHSAHQLCPLAGRVHASNNASMIVNTAKRRVAYRCFDEDCLKLLGAGAGANAGGCVDVSHHLEEATLGRLFGDDAASASAAPYLHRGVRHEEAVASSSSSSSSSGLGRHPPHLMDQLTTAIRRLQQFSDIDDACALLVMPPASLAGAGGNGARFLLGGRGGTLLRNTAVLDASGEFVGMLVGDHVVQGPLSHIEPALPADASFSFNQISARDGLLKSLEPHAGYSLTLYNMYDDGRNTAVAVQIPRKTPKNITQRSKVKDLMRAVQQASAAHVGRVMGDQFMPVVFNVQQHNINHGTINNNQITIAAENENGFPALRRKMTQFATDHQLRKLDGHIYEPMPGMPCTYRKLSSYEDFINDVLEGDDIYYDNPNRFDEALRFLKNVRHTSLPVLQPDRDLLSFANGVLVLSSAEFREHGDPALQGRVARHHIVQTYTGATDTPLLDIVLDAQFDREVAGLLCAMLGRLFFTVGQLDTWQVMPYLVGIGGTGKSLILAVVDSFFSEEGVGEIASHSEEVFGLDNLADKEVVIGRDMPEKLSRALKQEHMQSITSGERLSVAVKGKKAKHVRWTAPVIMASNHEPDYKNSGGQVSRRMVTFRFEHVVDKPREDLLVDILGQELPAVIARCLACYHQMRDRVKSAGGFWAAMPATIQSWQNRLSAATNKLHEFLEMDDDDRGCKIELVPGKVTWVSDFKEAYEACMEAKLDPYKQPHTFQKFGFRVNPDATARENVCRSCKQVAKGRDENKCCEEYSKDNRLKKPVIYDMLLSAMLRSTEPTF